MLNQIEKDKVAVAHSDLCRFIMAVQSMNEDMLDELSDKFIFMDPYLDESEKKMIKAAITYVAEELIAIDEEKGLTGV